MRLVPGFRGVLVAKFSDVAQRKLGQTSHSPTEVSASCGPSLPSQVVRGKALAWQSIENDRLSFFPP